MAQYMKIPNFPNSEIVCIKKGKGRAKQILAMQGKIFLIFSLVISLCCLIQMAESGDSSESSSSAAHIVYTERPQDEQPEAYNIRILASVLGSEEAAKEALIYSYHTAASGFAAKLTPEQVAEISKQPGVIQVVPSRTLQLFAPGMPL